MGARRLAPGQSITALEEAVEIIRGIWDADARGSLTVDGEFYGVRNAKRGPAPAHTPGIWIGAYKPRILHTVGRVADGWLPSLGYLRGGLDDLTGMNRSIDEGAEAAGRDPRRVRRLLNIDGRFGTVSRGLLDGPPDQWAEELTDITLTYGISGFILASDETEKTETFAHEIAPAVRREVAQARGR